MEAKGLKVSIAKPKVMYCQLKNSKNSMMIQNSGIGLNVPCGICGRGVRDNAIKEVLIEGHQYQCPRCSGKILNSVAPDETIAINLGNDKIECVQKFCYLGDMLGTERGAEAALRNRVRCAWGKFHELAPILTRRGVSLKLKGKFYRACVQSVLLCYYIVVKLGQ